MDHRDKIIGRILQKMEAASIDAYIVPSTDPHQSEYIPACWRFREWISGFTGSAGVVVLTRDFAGLWTDSRYFLQAEEQLKGCRIQLVKLVIPHTPEYIGWLCEHLGPGLRVGLDSRFFSVSLVRYFTEILQPAGISMDTSADLLTDLWTNRPKLPSGPVYEHPVEFAGVTRRVKLEILRRKLEEKKIDYQFIAPLDEIAWLLNLRGSDVNFCPVFISFALIGQKEAWLCLDLSKIPAEIEQSLRDDGISLREYDDIGSLLGMVPDGKTICIAPEKTSMAFLDLVCARLIVKEDMNLTTSLKAIKNRVEINGLRRAMVKDGIAWVKTLFWIETQLEDRQLITEMTVAGKIAENRAGQEHYMGESFHPISSFAHHGAVVHYSVTLESSIALEPNGIFLLDTGGHFLDGTTDTTRTMALGQPDRGQKTDFTLALKGTLAVSMLKFPAGTRGYQIDVLARMALWQNGKNYGHGTGHGVGFFLNVHEGPQTIGTSASGYQQVTLETGMVTTVEPAIYKDGEYGMRTENMTLVVPDIQTEYGTFLRFETLTLVPIDLKLIDVQLLSTSERDWINQYHRRVYTELAPYLDHDEKTWLAAATQPL